MKASWERGTTLFNAILNGGYPIRGRPPLSTQPISGLPCKVRGCTSHSSWLRLRLPWWHIQIAVHSSLSMFWHLEPQKLFTVIGWIEQYGISLSVVFVIGSWPMCNEQSGVWAKPQCWRKKGKTWKFAELSYHFISLIYLLNKQTLSTLRYGA